MGTYNVTGTSDGINYQGDSRSEAGVFEVNEDITASTWDTTKYVNLNWNRIYKYNGKRLYLIKTRVKTTRSDKYSFTTTANSFGTDPDENRSGYWNIEADSLSELLAVSTKNTKLLSKQNLNPTNNKQVKTVQKNATASNGAVNTYSQKYKLTPFSTSGIGVFMEAPKVAVMTYYKVPKTITNGKVTEWQYYKVRAKTNKTFTDSFGKSCQCETVHEYPIQFYDPKNGVNISVLEKQDGINPDSTRKFTYKVNGKKTTAELELTQTSAVLDASTAKTLVKNFNKVRLLKHSGDWGS